ncbi:hypothetical protein LEP1GSC145_4352, partial [Leptospira interrogans serovar Djasiman str. LT1649]
VLTILEFVRKIVVWLYSHILEIDLYFQISIFFRIIGPLSQMHVQLKFLKNKKSIFLILQLNYKIDLTYNSFLKNDPNSQRRIHFLNDNSPS